MTRSRQDQGSNEDAEQAESKVLKVKTYNVEHLELCSSL